VSDLKFVPQSMLDTWADLGKVQLEGNTLALPAENVKFQLTPAIRFVSILDGEDVHKLLTKVKTEQFVREELAGDVMADSCVIGETAYTVAPGFLAETAALAAAQASEATKKLAPRPPATPPAASAPKPAAPAPAAAPKPVAAAAPGAKAAAPAKSDADLLTKFLLESLE